MNRDELDDMKDNDAPSLESMLDVKLEELFHDLVTQHGPVETAKKLGVNYETVARSVESGCEISWSLRGPRARVSLTRPSCRGAKYDVIPVYRNWHHFPKGKYRTTPVVNWPKKREV